MATPLILKRAPVGDNPEDYSVLEDGVVVGRIFTVPTAPPGRPWMWASGHSAATVKRAAHGYEATREAAMAAFAGFAEGRGDGLNSPGGFNWSAQHLLILLDEEVADGDVTDIVHGEAEGRTLGALEERTKCVGHLPGAGKEEQDRRPADRGSQWRDRSGATSQSCGDVEA